MGSFSQVGFEPVTPGTKPDPPATREVLSGDGAAGNVYYHVINLMGYFFSSSSLVALPERHVFHLITAPVFFLAETSI